MAARITVLGSYAKALVITADRIPLAGETLLGRDYRETWGGKGSDMAVQAARLGANVEFVGVVGDDDHGREFARLMESEGVGTDRLRATGERTTGVGLIIKDTAGANLIVVDMGANELFSTADVDAASDAIAASDVVLAQLEVPLPTVLYGLSLARRAGAGTVLNPAPAVDLTGADLRDVDILTPNETEARVVLGLAPDAPVSNADVAAQILALGCGTVVMTLGEKGAATYTLADNDVVETTAPAWPVDTVDSNGAGDSFNAALCTALGEGAGLAEATSFATATAALCCTEWETVPSYHTRAQVEAFMKTREER
ncbi:MAG: ribokinase [Actinobacteria bacterium]|nr:ribokinase [Actinomycetota bacterium]